MIGREEMKSGVLGHMVASGPTNFRDSPYGNSRTNSFNNHFCNFRSL
jgi:hypothetical protein